MIPNISAAPLRFASRFRAEEGQALAEYSLIIVIVAVSLIAGLGLLALAFEGMFNDIIAAL